MTSRLAGHALLCATLAFLVPCAAVAADLRHDTEITLPGRAAGPAPAALSVLAAARADARRPSDALAPGRWNGIQRPAALSLFRGRSTSFVQPLPAQTGPGRPGSTPLLAMSLPGSAQMLTIGLGTLLIFRRGRRSTRREGRL